MSAQDDYDAEVWELLDAVADTALRLPPTHCLLKPERVVEPPPQLAQRIADLVEDAAISSVFDLLDGLAEASALFPNEKPLPVHQPPPATLGDKVREGVARAVPIQPLFDGDVEPLVVLVCAAMSGMPRSIAASVAPLLDELGARASTSGRVTQYLRLGAGSTGDDLTAINDADALLIIGDETPVSLASVLQLDVPALYLHAAADRPVIGAMANDVRNWAVACATTTVGARWAVWEWLASNRDCIARHQVLRVQWDERTRILLPMLRDLVSAVDWSVPQNRTMIHRERAFHLISGPSALRRARVTEITALLELVRHARPPSLKRGPRWASARVSWLNLARCVRELGWSVADVADVTDAAFAREEWGDRGCISADLWLSLHGRRTVRLDGPAPSAAPAPTTPASAPPETVADAWKGDDGEPMRGWHLDR